MKKEDLEAILGDGENTPDLGPIEEYLHAVATEPKLPDFAVGMCAARFEEAAPKLRDVLLRAADGKVLSDDESLLLFRGLHVLGGARDREACQPLLRLLRRPFQELNGLLGFIESMGMSLQDHYAHARYICSQPAACWPNNRLQRTVRCAARR